MIKFFWTKYFLYFKNKYKILRYIQILFFLENGIENESNAPEEQKKLEDLTNKNTYGFANQKSDVFPKLMVSHYLLFQHKVGTWLS